MSLDARQSRTARFIKHSIIILLVTIWTLPTLGLLVSSVRDKDQLTSSGWWTALITNSQSEVFRLPVAADQIEVALIIHLVLL